MDDRKLDALTKAAEPAPAASKPAPGPEEKELSKADEKLSSLLGGKK